MGLIPTFGLWKANSFTYGLPKARYPIAAGHLPLCGRVKLRKAHSARQLSYLNGIWLQLARDPRLAQPSDDCATAQTTWGNVFPQALRYGCLSYRCPPKDVLTLGPIAE